MIQREGVCEFVLKFSWEYTREEWKILSKRGKIAQVCGESEKGEEENEDEEENGE